MSTHPRKQKSFAQKSGASALVRIKSGAPALLSLLALLLSATFPALAFLSSPPVARQDNTTTLTPGASIQRDLNKGESHAYRVALDAGQYFHAVITQTGTRARALLYAPDGQTLLDLDCHSYDPTPLSVVAEDAGAYRIEVRSLEGDAAPGSYRLRVEEVRQATAQDGTRVTAERAFAEGERLRSEWKLESSRKAISKYEEALTQWQTAGDLREGARALKAIGEIFHLLGEPQKALRYYEQALALGQQINDLRLEGGIRNAIGSVYLHLGENQKAMASCEMALKLGQEAGNKPGEAQALDNLGEVYYYLGDLQKGLESHQHALGLWQALDDRRGQADALQYIGYCYYGLSETGKALEAFNRALGFCRLDKNPYVEALTLVGLAQLQAKSGEKQEALDLYRQAMDLFQSIGDKVWEASILNGTGYEFSELGDKQKALEYYDQALQLFRAASHRNGEAVALIQIGLTYYFLGKNPQALTYLQQALSISRELADQRLESYALNHLGQVYEAMGDRAKALDYFNRALPLFQTNEDRRGAAYALNNIGKVYEALNDKAGALDYYNRALALNRATEYQIGETATLYNISRAERDLGRLADARAHIEDSIGKIEALRVKVADSDLRASYFATAQQNYELYIDLLMRQRPDERLDALALHASERARARSLLESLIESRADIRQGVDPALLTRERELRRLLNDKAERQTRLLNGRHGGEEAAAIAKEIEAIAADYQQVRAQIRARSPRYAALTQPRPLALAEIQGQALDRDTLLLEYALGDERSYLWAVSADSLTSFELPRRAEVESAARRVYDLLTAPNQRVKGETPLQREERLARAEADYAQAAAALSRMVIGPVADMLGTRRLLVVADGALQYIPFAALPAPSAARPLIVDHEVVSLPSASALAVLRGELAGRKPAEKAVAVLADPVFSADDERLTMARRRGTSAPRPSSALPSGVASQTRDFERAVDEVGLARDGAAIARLAFSRREAEAIAAAAPAGQGLKALDFDASRATATGGELRRYRVVHFATHGLLNSEHPELSGVVLSLVDRDGRPQNGFLRLHEIYNLDLPAEMVVLSACQTGLGKEVRGEGLVGLTRGFMYAGAARVLASLWKVDDAATAELMRRMYTSLLKENLRPAAALRAAQVEMWRQPRWQSPYYWAAFVLQGEYR